MFPTEMHTFLQTNSHAKGGVAPLRQDLARHQHIENRRRQADLAVRLEFPAIIRAVLRNAATFLSAQKERAATLWTAGNRASR